MPEKPSDDLILDAAKEIWSQLNSVPWEAYPDLHDQYFDAARRAWLAFNPTEE